MKRLMGKCDINLKAILPDVAILLDHCYFDGCNWDLQIFQDLLKTVNENHIRKENRRQYSSFSNSRSTYLLFTLDDTGIEGLSIALSLLHSEIAKSLLHFFSSPDVLEDLKCRWSGLYAEEFVKNDLLDTFKRWQNAIADYYNIFVEQLKGPSYQPRKPTTEVQPFNLTPAKPRAIPIPEPIPHLAKHRAVPDSTYTLPEEFHKIEQSKKANFAESERLLRESEQFKPACAYTRVRTPNVNEKPSNTECKPKNKKHGTIPSEIPSIHTNTASVLREWNLYAKKEKIRRKRLLELEAGAFDSSDFMTWQMEQADHEKKERELLKEQHRLQSLLAREAAFHVKRKLIEERRFKVAREQKANLKRLAEAKTAKEQELKETVQVASSIAAMRKRSRLAGLKICNEKKLIASQLREETQKQLKTMREKLKAENERKTDLIKQIRIAESAWLLEKSTAPKQIDFACTPGLGLMEEMSLVELKERLVLLRKQTEYARQMKRNAILNEKQKKNELIVELLDRISRHKNVRSVAVTSTIHTQNNFNPLEHSQLEKQLSLLNKLKAERLALTGPEQKSSKNTSMINTLTKIHKEKFMENFHWRQNEKAFFKAVQQCTDSMHHPKDHLRNSRPWKLPVFC
ncbi:hypothetical protein PHET_01983 [Paragonimus heterotremus]|uniref:Cilia- and flagella-associated protein 99 n=1 Tax=Paragonimus heterotremus TaxID=100268 RepID=A0A8J4SR66_9TREM|nr:hypothetical protein PHET_01983 [Paragonimus heterotremus]